MPGRAKRASPLSRAPARSARRPITADTMPTMPQRAVRRLQRHAPSPASRRRERRRTAAPRSRTPGRARPGSRTCRRAPAVAALRERQPYVGAARLRRGAALPLPRGLPRRIDEVAEELRIRLQHHAGVVVLQARLVGLHRAVEGEEIRILAEGFGEDAVALAVALAADLLGLGGAPRRAARSRRGRRVARISCARWLPWARNSAASRCRSVCMRWYTAWLFCSGRSARRMRTSTTSMPKACASRSSCSRTRAISSARSSRTTCGERRLAEHAAQRRVEQDRELRVGALDRADRLVEAQRIVDAIAREGIDHEALLVGGDHLLRRRSRDRGCACRS